jgi:hypothetical protein
MKVKKGRLIFQDLTLLGSLFLIFFILYSSLCVIPNVYAATLEEKQSSYPGTPEKVVTAFIEAGLKSTITVSEMGLCNEIIKGQRKYFPDEKDVKVFSKTHLIDLSEPWGPFGGKYHVVTGFKIKEIKKRKSKATIKVMYKRLGWIWDAPMFIKKCFTVSIKESESIDASNPVPHNEQEKIDNDKKIWIWDKNECRFLFITNDTHEVTYHLAKPGQLWRITDGYEPHVSIDSAIKALKCMITERPLVSTLYPSANQQIEIKKDIEILKKHLAE